MDFETLLYLPTRAIRFGLQALPSRFRLDRSLPVHGSAGGHRFRAAFPLALYPHLGVGRGAALGEASNPIPHSHGAGHGGMTCTAILICALVPLRRHPLPPRTCYGHCPLAMVLLPPWSLLPLLAGTPIGTTNATFFDSTSGLCHGGWHDGHVRYITHSSPLSRFGGFSRTPTASAHDRC